MKKIIIITLTLFVSIFLFACNKVEKPSVADNTEHFDTITKTLTLTKDYQGKSFLTDGIGSATVEAYTDGDTTRFRLPEGQSIAVRYYAIDTPESTGNVEKWGKAASTFTKNQLKKASEVVLEATSDKAQHDSYGTRWLGYVWYRESANDSFKCLNLELVENGYTYNKGMNTDDYPYDSYFQRAEDFARSIKLRVHSELDDPDFSDEPILLTLHELVEDLKNTDDCQYYNLETEAGSKVQFEAYLESFSESSSGTVTFIAAELYDGNKYTINIFGNYTSKAESQMPVGHLYQITGRVNKYNGQFQISDISYNPIYPSTTKPIQMNYFVTFNSNLKYVSQYVNTLYTDITVTEIVSNDGDNLIIKGTANQRIKKQGVEQLKEPALELQLVIPKSISNYDEIEVGKKLRLQAYQFVADSNEFTLLANSTIRISDDN